MGVFGNLEDMLARGQDTALLRYALGNEYVKNGDAGKAIENLAEAVRLDPAYSAAWKLYGKALSAAGRTNQAASAFESGIAASEKKGDVQAAKEMRVFLKRLKKAAGA